uniref:Uncharacterized protein n=1 Tax=Glossina morsitans morsitans TaxID=37546 RepID=A0A1B0FEV3_GLOMM
GNSQQSHPRNPTTQPYKAGPQTHRNLRLPCNEARKDMNALSEPIASRPQRSQRHHASNFNPHLLESEPPAAYETSHNHRVQRVNLVKPEPIAAYETTNSDQVQRVVIVESGLANVDTRPVPTGQPSDIAMPESQSYNSADMTLCQREAGATPDGTAPILEEQSSLPQQQVIITTSQAAPQQQQEITVFIAHKEQPQHYSGHSNNNDHQQQIDYIPKQLSHCGFSNHVQQQQQQQQQQQVPTEVSTRVSSTIQRMPTYSNVNIVTPL